MSDQTSAIGWKCLQCYAHVLFNTTHICGGGLGSIQFTVPEDLGGYTLTSTEVIALNKRIADLEAQVAALREVLGDIQTKGETKALRPSFSDDPVLGMSEQRKVIEYVHDSARRAYEERIRLLKETK